MIASKRSTVLPLALALLGPFFLSAILATPTPAAAQHVVSQGADVHRLRIGAVPVFALSDGSVPMDLHQLLQHTTPAQTDALLRLNFQTNPVAASINVYLIQLPGKLVLIDTGSGELFGPDAGGGLLASFARAGFKPEQITDILITHVHSDHAGGLITDGPYLETKEYVGGFWVLEAADLGEAQAWGRKAAVACRAPVEVRPFH